jgi:hypothetical protein
MGKNVMVGAAVIGVALLCVACEDGAGTDASQYCEEAVIETEHVAAILLAPAPAPARVAPAPAPARPSAAPAKPSTPASKPSSSGSKSNAGAKQANLSRAPAPSRISTPKYQSYNSSYFQSNGWMWYYFAFHVDEDKSPEEGEFEAWLNDQSDSDLSRAEHQYHEERC